MRRRLAAILAADVVGYSRLIRIDEEGTIAALKALRADIIEPKIAEHGGDVVKLMGDGPQPRRRRLHPAKWREPWTLSCETLGSPGPTVVIA